MKQKWVWLFIALFLFNALFIFNLPFATGFAQREPDLSVLPLVVLTAIAAVLTWAGLAGLRRRDIG